MVEIIIKDKALGAFGDKAKIFFWYYYLFFGILENAIIDG